MFVMQRFQLRDCFGGRRVEDLMLHTIDFFHRDNLIQRRSPGAYSRDRQGCEAAEAEPASAGEASNPPLGPPRETCRPGTCPCRQAATRRAVPCRA